MTVELAAQIAKNQPAREAPAGMLGHINDTPRQTLEQRGCHGAREENKVAPRAPTLRIRAEPKLERDPLNISVSRGNSPSSRKEA